MRYHVKNTLSIIRVLLPLPGVAVDYILFAATLLFYKASSLTHSVAAPFRVEAGFSALTK